MNREDVPLLIAFLSILLAVGICGFFLGGSIWWALAFILTIPIGIVTAYAIILALAIFGYDVI